MTAVEFHSRRVHHAFMAEGARGVFFVWTEADRLYALHLSVVQCAAAMVEITPVPNTAPGLLGIIDVGGRIAPVISVAQRFGMKSSAELHHQLIIAESRAADGRTRLFALVAHDTIGLAEDEIIPATEVLPEGGHVVGVLKRDGAIVLVPNLEFLVSADELAAVDAAGGPEPAPAA